MNLRTHIHGHTVSTHVGKKVWILSRVGDGDVVIQGVFTTENKANKAKEDYEDSCCVAGRRSIGEYNFEWYLDMEEIQ